MRVFPIAVAFVVCATTGLAETEQSEPLDLARAFELAEDLRQLALTWNETFLMVPGTAFGDGGESFAGLMSQAEVRERLAMLPQDVAVPTVIFLHGCVGLGVSAFQFQDLAEAAGYAVIAPNSFARTLRPKNCDELSYSAGMFPPVWAYRRAELIYAVEQAKTLPWIDQDRILLAGFSEGAVATALWGSEVDVAGYLVLGWTCTAPENWGWIIGLRTPTDRSVLAIVSKDDPWYDRPGWRGDCGAAAPNRARVRSLVLDHGNHFVLHYPEAQEAVIEFLTNRKP